jgi:hypothetical protein
MRADVAESWKMPFDKLRTQAFETPRFRAAP